MKQCPGSHAVSLGAPMPESTSLRVSKDKLQVPRPHLVDSGGPVGCLPGDIQNIVI